jgi:hypothetical protein
VRTRSSLNYAEAVLQHASGQSIDDGDRDELLMLVGKSWGQYLGDCDAVREILFKRAMLVELAAIRTALERMAGE